MYFTSGSDRAFEQLMQGKVARSENEGGAWGGSMISVWTTPPLRV